MNILRRHSPDDEWVVLAPNRGARRTASERSRDRKDSSPGSAEESCPFCPPSRIAPKDYDMLIFPNDYPVLDRSVPLAGPLDDSVQEMPAYGVNDGVLFSSDHERLLHELPNDKLGRLLNLVAQRFGECYQDPLIQHAYFFVSLGDRFGHTEAHPHGQVLATPFVPTIVRRTTAPTLDQCLTCREITTALRDGRVIVEDDSCVAFVPAAARLAHEIWIVPREHGSSLRSATPLVRESLASLSKRLLRALAVDGQAPNIFSVYETPNSEPGAYHLRFEILSFSRPTGGEKYLGSYELALGVYVNPSVPESAAEDLRQRLAASDAAAQE